MKKRMLIKVVAPVGLAVALAGTLGAGTAFASSSHTKSKTSTHSSSKGTHTKSDTSTHKKTSSSS